MDTDQFVLIHIFNNEIIHYLDIDGLLILRNVSKKFNNMMINVDILKSDKKYSINLKLLSIFKYIRKVDLNIHITKGFEYISQIPKTLTTAVINLIGKNSIKIINDWMEHFNNNLDKCKYFFLINYDDKKGYAGFLIQENHVIPFGEHDYTHDIPLISLQIFNKYNLKFIINENYKYIYPFWDILDGTEKDIMKSENLIMYKYDHMYINQKYRKIFEKILDIYLYSIVDRKLIENNIKNITDINDLQYVLSNIGITYNDLLYLDIHDLIIQLSSNKIPIMNNKYYFLKTGHWNIYN